MTGNVIDAHVVVGPSGRACLSPDALRAVMEASGVAAALVSPPPDCVAVRNREGNDYIATLVKQNPGIIYGYAVANPWYGADAVRELRRAFDLGLHALKLDPAVQGFMLCHELVFPLVETAGEWGVPVYVRTGTPPGGLPLQLAELARRFPGVAFIMGRAGKTDFWLDVVPSLRDASNIWVDTSYDYPDLGLKVLVEEFGHRRLVFASDSPMSDMATEVAKVIAAGLPPSSSAAVLGGNINDLLLGKGRR